MNFRTINDIDELIKSKLYLIPRDIDLIVGIPRSGMLVATIIALHMNKPCVALEDVCNENINTFTSRIKFDSCVRKVLVVDDTISSGKTIAMVKETLKNIPLQFIYCTIYATEQSKHKIDIYFDILPHPRLFEYNIMNHMYLSQTMVDIDGVLCFDPTIEQNDDSEKYTNFIENAVPKFIPTKPIHTICSSRLKKYQKLTEKWLKSYNIEYDNLILLDLPDAKTRRALNCHGKFKGETFKNSPCTMFIESNLSQSKQIKEISGKCVYCVDTNQFFN